MQTVVVKIGGSLAGGHLHIVSRLVKELRKVDKACVLVHGGGPRISEALDAQGLGMPWHEGQRVTSLDAVQVVHKVLCQQVNQELVAALTSQGVLAKGLCGADGIIEAEPLPDLEQTADVRRIHSDSLHRAVETGVTPVIAPVGRDARGNFCNINADIAAASVATALQSERIIFLTDVDGIYYDWEKRLRLVDVSLQELQEWYEQEAFNAGMIPKVRAVSRALKGHVGSAYVVNGSQQTAVAAAGLRLQGDEWSNQYGTRITYL